MIVNCFEHRLGAVAVSQLPGDAYALLKAPYRRPYSGAGYNVGECDCPDPSAGIAFGTAI